MANLNCGFQARPCEGMSILRAVFWICEVCSFAGLNSCPEVFCHLKTVAVYLWPSDPLPCSFFFQRVSWLVWIDNCRKTENLRPQESEAVFTANGSKWLFQGWFIPSVSCEGAFWEELALYAVSSENQNKAEWTFWYSAFPRSYARPLRNVFYSGCTQNVKICLSALILLACPHPQGRLIIATQKKFKSVSTFGKELLAMQMPGRLW